MAESNPLIPEPPVGEAVAVVTPEQAAAASAVSDTTAPVTEAPLGQVPLNVGEVSVETAASTHSDMLSQKEAAKKPEPSIWARIKNSIPLRATPVPPPAEPAVATAPVEPFTAQTIPAAEMDTAMRQGAEAGNAILESAPGAVAAVAEADNVAREAQQPAPPTPDGSAIGGTAGAPDHLTDTGTTLQTGWADGAVPPPPAAEAQPEEPAPAVEQVSAIAGEARKDESTSSALVGEMIDEAPSEGNQGAVEVTADESKPDPLAVTPPQGVDNTGGLGQPPAAEPFTANTIPANQMDAAMRQGAMAGNAILESAPGAVAGLPLETGSEPKASTEEPAAPEETHSPAEAAVSEVVAPEVAIAGTDAVAGRSTAAAFGITPAPAAPAAPEMPVTPVASDIAEEPEAHEDPTGITPTAAVPVAPPASDAPQPAFGSAVDQAVGVAPGAGADQITEPPAPVIGENTKAADDINNAAIKAWNTPIAPSETPAPSTGLGTATPAETMPGGSDPTDPNGAPSGTPPVGVGV